MTQEEFKLLCQHIREKLYNLGLTAEVKKIISLDETDTGGISTSVARRGDLDFQIWLDTYLSDDASSAPRLCYCVWAPGPTVIQSLASRFGEKFVTVTDNDVLKDKKRRHLTGAAVKRAKGHLCLEKYNAHGSYFGSYPAASDNFEEEAVSFFEKVWRLSDAKTLYLEGNCQQITTDRYERNPAARKLCLEHYGEFRCQICEVNLEEKYGAEVGREFIHVHHLTQVADGKKFTDPIKDLLPVCPNCHAMLHRRRPPYTPAELKAFIIAAKSASDSS